jgi:hypothetical protein
VEVLADAVRFAAATIGLDDAAASAGTTSARTTTGRRRRTGLIVRFVPRDASQRLDAKFPRAG